MRIAQKPPSEPAGRRAAGKLAGPVDSRNPGLARWGPASRQKYAVAPRGPSRLVHVSRKDGASPAAGLDSRPMTQADLTRQRLVRAALELFTAQGYHDTTTPQISKKAGVAEGTIYRHFHSKQHLLNELYRGAARRAGKLPRDAGPPPPTRPARRASVQRSEQPTAELQSPCNLVYRPLLRKKKQ